MPINNYDTNLRVETNVEGHVVDNDEWQEVRAHIEHSKEAQPQSHSPWATTYVPPEELQRLAEEQFYSESLPPDPAVTQAVQKDLRNRNLRINK